MNVKPDQNSTTDNERPEPRNVFDSDQWVTLFLWDLQRDPSLVTDREKLEAWFEHMFDEHAEGCANIYGYST